MVISAWIWLSSPSGPSMIVRVSKPKACSSQARAVFGWV